MATSRLIGAAAFALTAAAVGACGDDGAAAALSKPEFIEQADARCAVATVEMMPHFESMWADIDGLDMDDPANQEIVFTRFEEVLDVAAPAWRRMSDDIAALGRPEGDEELIGDLLADFDVALTEMEQTVTAAVAGDEAARERLDGDDPMADANRQAREYGLTVCGAED